MTGLIERDLVIDKLKQGYFDTNLQQGKNDPCVIDAMIDWSIRQVKDVPIYNPWHTGTPTESGEYLVCRVPKAGYLYRYNQLCTFGDLMGSLDHKIFYIGEPGKDSFENITDSVIAWQKIEPYKEKDK